MKHALTFPALLLLSACAGVKPGSGPLTSQQYFDVACHYASDAVKVAKPFIPELGARLGPNGPAALGAAVAVIGTACANPLDISNAAAVTQRVYDAGGQIVALVVQVLGQ